MKSVFFSSSCTGLDNLRIMAFVCSSWLSLGDIPAERVANMLKSFKEVIERASKMEGKKIAVAAANDLNTLKTFAIAKDRGLAKGLLVGDADRIEKLAAENGIDLSGQEIYHEQEDAEAARVACDMVRKKQADVLMKGLVKTSTFLKAVLDADRGLRSGKLLSHVFVFEDRLNGKLVLLTDGGINIRPDVEEKAEIIKNAVELYRAMGGEEARVAALAAIENVNEKMAETVDARKLEDMSKEGALGNCKVQGPLALDNAISKEAAKVKGLEGPVVGSADVLLAPDIASGNLLGKSLLYYGKSANAGTVVGTSAPVIFLSRADDENTKLNSIALCLAVSESLG